MKLMAKQESNKHLTQKLSEVQKKREKVAATPALPPGFRADSQDKVTGAEDDDDSQNTSEHFETTNDKHSENDNSEQAEKHMSDKAEPTPTVNEEENSDKTTEHRKRKLPEIDQNDVDPTTKKKRKKKQHYDEDSQNYSTWVPPAGQTGDGRTPLNEKFGY